MIYFFAVIFILSIILNIILLKIVLSSYVGIIHVNKEFTWMEFQSENSLNKKIWNSYNYQTLILLNLKN